MHGIHLTFHVCVRHTMRAAGQVLRIVASQHHNAGAAAALQVGGLGDKFIADAQRIIGGQLRVFSG